MFLTRWSPLLLLVACSTPASSDIGADAGGSAGTDASTPSPHLDTVEVDVVPGNPDFRRRSHAALAKDPRSGDTYLSGGISGDLDNNNVELGDIMKWSGGNWVQVANDLYPESNHGFTYLPAYEKFAVFGNNPEVGWFLWDSSSGAISELQTFCNLGCPLGRSGHAMSYWPERDAAVLFGGVGGAANSIANILRGDTYFLEGSEKQWTGPNGPGPSARREAAMAYDPTSGVIWLFGGFDEDSFSPLNDLWRLDQSGWQLIEDNLPQLGADFESSTRPAGRSGATLSFHPGLGKMLLIGGRNSQVSFNQERYLSYWTWDGQNWERLKNGRNADLDHPDTRFVTWDDEHATIYDEDLDAMLVVGGASHSGQTRILRIVASDD